MTGSQTVSLHQGVWTLCPAEGIGTRRPAGSDQNDGFSNKKRSVEVRGQEESKKKKGPSISCHSCQGELLSQKCWDNTRRTRFLLSFFFLLYSSFVFGERNARGGKGYTRILLWARSEKLKVWIINVRVWVDLCKGENSQVSGSWYVVLYFGWLHRAQSRASYCVIKTQRRRCLAREKEKDKGREREAERNQRKKKSQKSEVRNWKRFEEDWSGINGWHLATHSSWSSEALEACRLLFFLLTGEWTLIKPVNTLL